MNIHEIKDIVKNRQSEAVIKQWIDNNMGFWSVAYEKFFNDEYIAVGQYNFSSGPYDYLILCSLSKMKVIVIEIKGAEFPFINNSGSVNAEINYAHQQVRQRFNDIQSSYSDFRIKIHDYRQNILTIGYSYSICN